MALLDRSCDFSGPVYRNIVSLRVSANLFDDLVGDAFGGEVRVTSEERLEPLRARGVEGDDRSRGRSERGVEQVDGRSVLVRADPRGGVGIDGAERLLIGRRAQQ